MHHLLFGAVLLNILPLQSILLIDVATAILGIVLLYFFVKTKPVTKKEVKVTYFHDLKEGLTYTKNHSFIKKFLIIAAIFNILISPLAALTPLQVTRDFGSEEWMLAVAEIIFFVGSIARWNINRYMGRI